MEDAKVMAARLEYARRFGVPLEPFAFPTEQDMGADQRQATWSLIRLTDVGGSAVRNRLADPAAATARQLCAACRCLPEHFDETARLSDGGDCDSYYVHLENAQTLPSSSETCIVCALFAFVTGRTQATRTSRGYELGEDSFLPGPLRLKAVLESANGRREGQGGGAKRPGIVALELWLPWALKQARAYPSVTTNRGCSEHKFGSGQWFAGHPVRRRRRGLPSKRLRSRPRPRKRRWMR